MFIVVLFVKSDDGRHSVPCVSCRGSCGDADVGKLYVRLHHLGPWFRLVVLGQQLCLSVSHKHSKIAIVHFKSQLFNSFLKQGLWTINHFRGVYDASEPVYLRLFFYFSYRVLHISSLVHCCKWILTSMEDWVPCICIIPGNFQKECNCFVM